MAVILFAQANYKFGYTGSEEDDICIKSDGTAYYAYLPEYIVYRNQSNFNFIKKIQENYPRYNLFSMIKTDPETHKVYNKFYIGTALVQSPFYFIAHKLHQWNNWNADGYQIGYRFSIQLAAIFYWLLGVFALFKLFARLHFTRFSILVGIAVLSFGTNLNEYISYLPTMSHAYSFCFVACFLNVAHLWVEKNENKYLLLAFFLLGIISIIRPVNFLVLLIVPFLFKSLSHFYVRLKELVLKKSVVFLASMVVFLIPILIQVGVTYDHLGVFSLYTYSEEGFTNWSNPQIFNVLFSYKKGFFVYAPALLSLFIGMYFFIKHSTNYFLVGWFVCMGCWLYVISSWWSWDYGGGVGMRALIELLPLMLFPLLYLFKHAGKFLLAITSVILVGGIVLYQIFQIQLHMNILHCCEMNKEHFWNVFLKTDKRFRWMIDFNLMRETLDETSLNPEFRLKERQIDWEIENIMEPKIWFTFDQSFPVLHLDTTRVQFKAMIEGEIKLGSEDINPFVHIQYYSKDVFVEESIFTIGSNIENPFEFEAFKIDVNHNLAEKHLDKVKIEFIDGGGNPIYKNRVITKFE